MSSLLLEWQASGEMVGGKPLLTNKMLENYQRFFKSLKLSSITRSDRRTSLWKLLSLKPSGMWVVLLVGVAEPRLPPRRHGVRLRDRSESLTSPGTATPSISGIAYWVCQSGLQAVRSSNVCWLKYLFQEISGSWTAWTCWWLRERMESKCSAWMEFQGICAVVCLSHPCLQASTNTTSLVCLRGASSDILSTDKGCAQDWACCQVMCSSLRLLCIEPIRKI